MGIGLPHITQILKSSRLLIFFLDGIVRSSVLVVDFVAAIIKRDFWHDCIYVQQWNTMNAGRTGGIAEAMQGIPRVWTDRS